MITVYGYVPAWGLPDISPFVTKVVNYMTIDGHRVRAQDAGPGDARTRTRPTASCRTSSMRTARRSATRTRIIEYLEDKYGDKLDTRPVRQPTRRSAWRSAAGRGAPVLVGHHRAALAPRWSGSRSTSRTSSAAPRSTPEEAQAPARVPGAASTTSTSTARAWAGAPTRTSWSACKADIDALSTFLGDKPFFLGDEPTSFDAIGLLDLPAHRRRAVGLARPRLRRAPRPTSSPTPTGSATSSTSDGSTEPS